MKTERRWIISFIIISIVCIIGAFWPTVTKNNYVVTKFGTTKDIVPADVAWMLTSCCLVLIMTPGLSFFMAEWSARKT
jgi:Amt family ammonium transporter